MSKLVKQKLFERGNPIYVPDGARVINVEHDKFHRDKKGGETELVEGWRVFFIPEGETVVSAAGQTTLNALSDQIDQAAKEEGIDLTGDSVVGTGKESDHPEETGGEYD